MRLWDRDFKGRKERMVGDVLFPLPMDSDPPHIYLKTEKETISLTKYDPYALRELALEDDLRLRPLPRFDFLLNLPSKRRLSSLTSQSRADARKLAPLLSV